MAALFLSEAVETLIPDAALPSADQAKVAILRRTISTAAPLQKKVADGKKLNLRELIQYRGAVNAEARIGTIKWKVFKTMFGIED